MPWTLDTMKVDAASLMSGKGLGNCRCVMQCSWHGIVFQQCAVQGNVIRSMSHALGVAHILVVEYAWLIGMGTSKGLVLESNVARLQLRSASTVWT